MSDTKKRGPKPRPPEQLRGQVMNIQVTSAEKDRYRSRAAALGLSLSAYIRDLADDDCLAAAESD